MVLAAFAIIPILAMIFVWLLHTIFDLLQFILNIFIGCRVLMWLAISVLVKFIYNCWWYVASTANNLFAYIWARVSLPIDFAVHVLKHFGLLSLSMTHLVLRILYYIFLL